jgi:presequence protease
MNCSVNSHFELIRQSTIDNLAITVEHYRHRATGGDHYHFASDSDENVFLVALRTLPKDSTGVAHILEHTVLCGSEKYPVRDPFFMMIRRSLNTFMNAFTSSDWTAYPFASQNLKDFNNLLDVYLDSVFFSRLHELDFAQEGHRVEFADTENPNSELVFKGVVFNEMKGAMSSVSSVLWHTICEELFSETTYHYNSGGEPADIPNLSYEQLLAFYRSHYHPSNAIFMTFGNIPATEHHTKFEQQVLHRFSTKSTRFSVDDEPRLHTPKCVVRPYSVDANDDGDLNQKSHVVLGWLLGKSAELEDLFTANLLSSVLLDNSGSPLQHALESSELGNAPSPLCGLEDSNRELIFVCGLEGCRAEDSDAIEAMILKVLEDVATHGVPQEHVEAVLHQLELHQREIGGDGYPYGLQIMLQTLTAATHDGDILAVLDIEETLAKLREDIKDPAYIKSLARRLLLDNTHRVRLTLVPDTELAAARERAEAERLSVMKSQMTDEDKAAVIAKSHALKARQESIDDDSILPKVTLEDIPADIRIIHGDVAGSKHLPIHIYDAGTNGICYQQLVIPLPSLNDDELAILPFYTQALTELGVGDKDYRETQAWQSAVCGGLNAFSSVRGAVDDVNAISSYFVLSSKSLLRNQHAMNDLMYATMHDVRFEELSRIRELVAQTRARKEQSVTGNGHVLAMMAASAAFSPAAEASNRVSGLPGIQFVKALDKRLDEKAALEAFAGQLQAIHQKILAQSRRILLVCEAEQRDICRQVIEDLWLANSPDGSQDTSLSLATDHQPHNQLWTTNTQVNFCAVAYETVPVDHPDAAALSVLGPFLRNGYLHRAIREQGGAYGGGASQDSSIATFRFFSYRDPRIEGTLEDFEKSLHWLEQTQHTPQALEEAILGVIGSMDKPGSPAGEAKQAFQNLLFDRSDEQRRRFRQRIVAVTIDDLRRVAKAYLKPELRSTAIISHSGNSDKVPASFKQYKL